MKCAVISVKFDVAWCSLSKHLIIAKKKKIKHLLNTRLSSQTQKQAEALGIIRHTFVHFLEDLPRERQIEKGWLSARQWCTAKHASTLVVSAVGALTLARQRLSETMLAILTKNHFWLLSEHMLCYSHNWFKIPQQNYSAITCFQWVHFLHSHPPQDPPLFLSDTHLAWCAFLNKFK